MVVFFYIYIKRGTLQLREKATGSGCRICQAVRIKEEDREETVEGGWVL